MLKVKYLNVEITKGKMSKIVTSLPQWEAQVLVALWGEEAQIIGEGFVVRELPDVNDEFTRLANKYGPRDEDVPIVARVYGSFGPGLRSLENEFQVSIVRDGDNSGNGIVAPTSADAKQPVAGGEQLPGSDKTFGPDAVPALAGNTVVVDGEQKPIEEVLLASADITDLITGKEDGGDVQVD